MNADRHIQVEGSGPESVVFFRRVRFATGKSLEENRLETHFNAGLHFRDHVRDIMHQRQDAHADEPVWIYRAILFRQPTVIRAHHRLVSIIVLDTAPELWPALLRRK